MKTMNDYTDSWLQSPSMRKAGKSNSKHLKRALKELLELLGFSTLALKPREFYEFLNHLTLEQFFEAVRARLLAEEAAQRQAASGLNAKFWIDGICELHKQVVASKKSQTTKNPKIALIKFISFLVRQPGWQLLCPFDVPEVRSHSCGKALPRVYPDRVYERYGLPRHQWTPKLLNEAAELTKFWLSGGEEVWEELLEAREAANQPLGRKPKMGQAKLETIENLLDYASQYFGWQMQHLQVGKEDLSFHSLTNPVVLRRFRSWQRKRGRSHAIVVNLIKVGIVVAKQENFAKTERRKWEDVSQVLDLQDLQVEFVEKYREEQRKSEKQKKPLRDLSHPQLEQLNVHLLQRCASFMQFTDSKTGKTHKHKRSQCTIVWDRLIYTACSFLVYAPVRQQQIRTAAEGESLLRRLDEEGSLAYVLYSTGHKLERHTNEAHIFWLSRNLTSVLDTWINTYRPMAEQAVESLENWLEFWGHDPDELQRLQARLEAAQRGQCSKEVQDIQSYMKNLAARIHNLTRRIEAFPIAQKNLKAHNHLFFSLGGKRPESFGKPLSSDSMTKLVSAAMAEASRAVFERAYLVTPHVFRYVAALHVRRIKGNINQVCEMMNHSLRTSDDYAEKTRDPVIDAPDPGYWWLAG